MGFSTEQIAALDAKLNPSHVKSRNQSGRSLSYIEGWHAIAEANRIFGFDGWVSETVEIRLVSERERKLGTQQRDGWGVSYVCKVRVTAGGIVREGVGAGHGMDVDLGNAHESAIKEAETDARKRALMTFGNPFGLALYDKTRENVGIDEPANDPPVDRRSSNSLKKDGSWTKAMDALRVAIDLGEDAVFAANRNLETVVQSWPPSWQEQYKDALERAIDRARSVAA